MFSCSEWKCRSCLFWSISGSSVFVLWRSPATHPLAPAVPVPIGCCRALFCASQGDALRPWLQRESCWAMCMGLVPLCMAMRWDKPQQNFALRVFCSSSSVWGQPPEQIFWVRSVLSNWSLYEHLYPWHLKLVAFSLSSKVSPGWTVLLAKVSVQGTVPFWVLLWCQGSMNQSRPEL